MSAESKSSSPAAPIRKLMGFGASFLRRGFNSSKCKTEAKLATARIKLLRNRREAQVRQMRRDIALLLQSRQEDTARIRVEHVIREQNIMAANEIIELFCELVVARLSIIAKQRECPADLKEGISSLIYAAPRCSEIPELYRIRDIFEKKYGKDFVSAASDLRPDSGVNGMLIEKLSVRKPTGEVKLKVMKELAKEYQIEWDTKESELELLKPPKEFIEGPRSFVSAASLPVRPTHTTKSMLPDEPNDSDIEGSLHFKDAASAARAVAESADKAVSAAQAAAYLAQQDSHQLDQATSLDNRENGLRRQSNGSQRQSSNSTGSFVTNDPKTVELKPPGRIFNSQSFNGSNNIEDDDDMDLDNLNDKRIFRRNNCTVRRAHSDIKFDNSDGLTSDSDEDGGQNATTAGSIQAPPNRPAPALPPRINQSEGESPASSHSLNSVTRVHPKLPDYDALAARFEALKSRRSMG